MKTITKTFTILKKIRTLLELVVERLEGAQDFDDEEASVLSFLVAEIFDD